MHDAIKSFEDGCLIDEVIIATKGGMARLGDKSTSWRNFVTPTALQKTITESVTALGGHIDIWQLHHPPEGKSTHSVESCMRVAEEGRTRGDITHIGLCNASQVQIGCMHVFMLMCKSCMY